MATLCGQSGQACPTCSNSTSGTSERLGLVKPAATLQLLEPSGYTQQCLRHNRWPAWFCSDQISLRSDILLTSDLSERTGLVVSPPSTSVCSRDEQLVSRFIHSNQHQQSSFNSRLVLQGLSERMAKVKRFL